MTNGEKFKTPQERAEAFDKFCKSNATEEGMCMPDCKLFYSQDDSKDYCGHCEFYWLNLEAENKKELPCPCCGSDKLSVISFTEASAAWVECQSCHYRSMECKTEEEAVAAHNRVAKAVMEAKEC